MMLLPVTRTQVLVARVPCLWCRCRVPLLPLASASPSASPAASASAAPNAQAVSRSRAAESSDTRRWFRVSHEPTTLGALLYVPVRIRPSSVLLLRQPRPRRKRKIKRLSQCSLRCKSTECGAVDRGGRRYCASRYEKTVGRNDDRLDHWAKVLHFRSLATRQLWLVVTSCSGLVESQGRRSASRERPVKQPSEGRGGQDGVEGRCAVRGKPRWYRKEDTHIQTDKTKAHINPLLCDRWQNRRTAATASSAMTVEIPAAWAAPGVILPSKRVGVARRLASWCFSSELLSGFCSFCFVC
jgi:hypothetical protein